MDMETNRGFLKSVIVVAKKVKRCAVEYLSPDFIWETYTEFLSLEVIRNEWLVHEDQLQVLEKYPSRDSRQLRRRLLIKGIIDCVTMTACSLIAYREKKALSLVPPAILVCRWRSLYAAQNMLRKVKQLILLNKRYDLILEECFEKIHDINLIGQAQYKIQSFDVTRSFEVTNIFPLYRMAWYQMPALRIVMMDTIRRLAFAFDGAFSMHAKETISLAVNLEQQAFYSVYLDPELEPAQKDTIPSLRALTDVLDQLRVIRSAFLSKVILEHDHYTNFDNISILEECHQQLKMALLEHRWTIDEAMAFLKN